MFRCSIAIRPIGGFGLRTGIVVSSVGAVFVSTPPPAAAPSPPPAFRLVGIVRAGLRPGAIAGLVFFFFGRFGAGLRFRLSVVGPGIVAAPFPAAAPAPALAVRFFRSVRFFLVGRARTGHGLFDSVFRRDQRFVGVDQHPEVVALLDCRQLGPFLVEDVKSDLRRHDYRDFFGPLPGAFLLNGAQNGQRRRFGRTDQPAAAAGRTCVAGNFENARPQPLARHFQQSERADPADLYARPVAAHGGLEAPFDRVAIAAVLHVDEVDDDEACQIAKLQLPRDFVGRLQIRLQGRFLDVAFARRPAGVDVDRHQRLGTVQHDGTARLELDDGALDIVDLRFDLVALEQGDLRLLVGPDPLGVAGDQELHEVLGRPVSVVALDQDLVDLLSVEVADRTLDQVALFVDQGRRRRFQRALANFVPQFEQVFVVAADFRLGAPGARGPDDDGHAVGNIEFVEDFLQTLAIGHVGDLARNAAAPRRVRHQNAIAAGQGNVAGDRRALVAAFLLRDLNEDDLPPGDNLLYAVAAQGAAAPLAHILNFVAAYRIDIFFRPRGARAPARSAARFLVFAFRFARGIGGRRLAGPVGSGLVAGIFPVAVVCWGGVFLGGLFGRGVVQRFDRFRFGIAGFFRLGVGGSIDLLFFRLGGRRLLPEDFLAVLDRDAIIVRMDFVEGEETVPVSAIVDECRLERRFHPCHLGEINIAFQLGFPAAFEVEIVQPVAADDDHPGLFGVSRVNQHACRHRCLRTAARPTDVSRSLKSPYGNRAQNGRSAERVLQRARQRRGLVLWRLRHRQIPVAPRAR